MRRAIEDYGRDELPPMEPPARKQDRPGNLSGKGYFTGADDPRRYSNARKLVPGTNATLSELCRLKTVEALDVIVRILEDEKAPIAERRKAAEGLLDRGWGKPTEHVKVETDGLEGKDPKTLSTDELLAIIVNKHEESRAKPRRDKLPAHLQTDGDESDDRSRTYAERVRDGSHRLRVPDWIAEAGGQVIEGKVEKE